ARFRHADAEAGNDALVISYGAPTDSAWSGALDEPVEKVSTHAQRDALEGLPSPTTANAPAAARYGCVLAGGRGRFRTADICLVSLAAVTHSLKLVKRLTTALSPSTRA
ncbi:hypothetical protein ACWD60_40940, partial [Streptomyces sp. NPDC005167]